MSIRSILFPPAFHKLPEYQAQEKAVLASKKAPDPCFMIADETTASSCPSNLFNLCMALPRFFYAKVHSSAAGLLLSNVRKGHFEKNFKYDIDTLRSKIDISGEWKVKRLALRFGRLNIDAAIVGRESTLENKRWVLFATGSASSYETELADCGIRKPDQERKKLLEALNANMLIFNIPGVGASSPTPSHGGMVRAHQVALEFLTNESIGIGAKEVILYGGSMGGGVQAEALLGSHPQEGVRYVLVKDRTFSQLSEVAKGAGGTVGLASSALVKGLGWNVRADRATDEWKRFPEIVVQTSRHATYVDIESAADIIDDGVISREASLAAHYLNNPSIKRANQTFLGIPDDHNKGMDDWNPLAGRIIKQLESMSL